MSAVLWAAELQKAFLLLGCPLPCLGSETHHCAKEPGFWGHVYTNKETYPGSSLTVIQLVRHTFLIKRHFVGKPFLLLKLKAGLPLQNQLGFKQTTRFFRKRVPSIKTGICKCQSNRKFDFSVPKYPSQFLSLGKYWTIQWGYNDVSVCWKCFNSFRSSIKHFPHRRICWNSWCGIKYSTVPIQDRNVPAQYTAAFFLV